MKTIRKLDQSADACQTIKEWMEPNMSEVQQTHTIFVNRFMDNSWSAIWKRLYTCFSHFKMLVFADLISSVTRHLFTSYNTEHTQIDQPSTRIIDAFACFISIVVTENILHHILFRAILNVMSAISLLFASFHLALQCFASLCAVSAICALNFMRFVVLNLMIEMLILKILPNAFSLVMSLTPSLISHAARQQTSRNAKKLWKNLISFTSSILLLPQILSGTTSMYLSYNQILDPEALSNLKPDPHWLQVSVLWKALTKSIGSTITQIGSNIGFILLSPPLFFLSVLHSVTVMLRAFARIVLCPIPVILIPMQKMFWGHKTAPATLKPLSYNIALQGTPPNDNIAKKHAP